MNLKTLLEGLPNYKIFGKKEKDIKEIVDDSRSAKYGSLFVAIRGLNVDSHRFISEVIQKGAVVVVGERMPKKNWLKKITYVHVKNSRSALGFLASAWYGNPSSKLKVIGVTGTDGKTTTANLIYWILKEGGKKVGLISSISAKIGNKEYDTGFHVTNPDPIPLQKFLAKMVIQKCEYAVLEVTSHGLDQERVAGVKFDVGVLTNITHEHLDYHKTWESYRDAKKKLFERATNAVVLNKDDQSFGFVKRIISKRVGVISYSLQSNKSDIHAMDIISESDKTRFTLVFGDKQVQVKTSLFGNYNISNILGAVGVGLYYKVPMIQMKKAIESFQTLTGRLEEIINKKGLKIYIDFAHTPNALKEVLTLLFGKKGKGRLIVICGSAGERDSYKRPKMGEISANLADISIFTAEDPRSEDFNDIISQIAKGAERSKAQEIEPERLHELIHGYNKHTFSRIPERGEAIAFAIQKLTKKGDIIVICGKGHEKSMAYNGKEYSWSDQEAVRIALKGGVKRIMRSQ